MRKEEQVYYEDEKSSFKMDLHNGKIKKHFLCQAAVCKASRISVCAYAMLWSADDQGNDAVGTEP